MDSILDPYFYAYNPELLAFENAWIRYMKNGVINKSVIKSEISDSWIRCRERGLDAMDDKKLDVLPYKELYKRINDNEHILKTVVPYMDAVFSTIKGTGIIISLIDSDGYVLKRLCDDDMVEACDLEPFVPGANRSEDVAGTSSIGLALRNKKPVMVAGAEHYMHILHRWTCSAAPVLDRDSNVVCVLSVGGSYEVVHPHTLGLVSAVTKAIENELFIQNIYNQVRETNNQLKVTIAAVTEGIMYVSGCMITQINQRMCDLIGEKMSSVKGKKITDIIVSSPGIETYTSNPEESHDNEKIVLYGNGINYNCFVDIKPVVAGEDSQKGQVFIFKRVDEIKDLASKIEYQAKYVFSDIVGSSKAIRQTIEVAMKAAEHNVRIVIEGESGTGKEMFAQSIHNQSQRRGYPFIAVDCGAVPVDLLESELFGYEGGSFTGAKREGKQGLFEVANGGTMFLDEVGNMSMEMQQKLLRVLQENVISRIGGAKQIPVDVRIIAATNVNLEEKIIKGTFRQDLYYRLNVIHIQTPSLRERPEDISLLANYFISKMSSGKNIRMDNKVIKAIESFDWPGNVRQLQNAVEYAMIMSKDNTIKLENLPMEVTKEYNMSAETIEPESVPLNKMIADYVNYVVKNSNENISKAADTLKVSRSTIYKYLNS